MIFCWLGKRVIQKDFSVPKISALYPSHAWGWLLFLLLCLLSLTTTVYPTLTLRAVFTKYLPYCLLVMSIYENVDHIRILKNALAVGALTLLLTMLNGWIQYVWGVDITGNKVQVVYIEPQDIKRISGSFSHPNDYASFLIALIPLLSSFCLAYVKKIKFFLVSLILSLGAITSLYLTESRGAIVALIAASTTILFLWKRKWGVLFFSGILILMMMAPLPLTQNIRNTFNFQSPSSGSLRDRIYLWETTLDMIKERPLFGWGLNTYARVHKGFSGNKDSWYTHNCYLQMASEIGLFGLSAYLFLLGSIFLYFYRETDAPPHKKERIIFFGLLTSFLAIVFHAFVDTTFYSLTLATSFWLLMALGFSYGRLKDSLTPTE